MTTTAEKKPKKVEEEKSEDRVAGEKLVPTIAKTILKQLGKPPTLIETRVHHLWDNRFRVDVWSEVPNPINQLVSFKITDSFFVHASPQGEIEYSNPKIIKKY